MNTSPKPHLADMKFSPGFRFARTFSLASLGWFAASHADAITAVWQGPTNGNWFTPGSWSPQGLPTSGDNIIIDQNGSAVVSAPGAVGATMNLGTELGSGILTVQGGGTGIVSGLSVNAGSNLTVTGAGSAWTVNGSLNAQYTGATVLVTSGASLTSNATGTSDYFDYGSKLTITGTGTSWTSRNSVALYKGTIEFLDHATISTGRMDLGVYDDNIAVLNASGGAQWTASAVIVDIDGLGAGNGTTTLNLFDGASLTTTRTQTNAIRIGSAGRVNIGIGGLAGTITTAGVTFTAAGGILSFNHTNDTVLNAPVIGPGQIIKAGSGTTTLGGINIYTGTTTVTEGTLHITGSASASSFSVATGARLSGNGATGPVTLDAGASLTPGTSPSLSQGSAGLVTVGSGSDFGGTITLELGGLTRGSEYDAINVSGGSSLTLGGTLNVTFINSFMPTVGDTFQLFNAANFSGSFAQLNLPIAAGEWDTSQLYTTGTIAVAVPEPATLSLLAATLLVPALRRRR